MKIVVEYPSPAEEVEIVQRMGVAPPEPSESLSIAALGELQHEADRVFVAREVVDYAVNLVFASREPQRFGLGDLGEFLQYGASPRASLGLISAGRALALLRGRSYVLPQDVYDVAPDIFRHRLVLSYEALARDITVNDVLGRILSTVPAPRVAPSQDPSAHHAVATPQPPAAGWGQQDPSLAIAPTPAAAPAPIGPPPGAAAPPAPAAPAAPAPWVPPTAVPGAQPEPPRADDPGTGWAAPGGGR
jgi:MoxR-like ATPase